MREQQTHIFVAVYKFSYFAAAELVSHFVSSLHVYLFQDAERQTSVLKRRKEDARKNARKERKLKYRTSVQEVARAVSGVSIVNA